MKQKLLLLCIGLFISFSNYAQVATQPSDLTVCDDNNDGFAFFDLTVLDSEVLGSQNPEDFIVTYYETQSDADNAINAIPTSYINITNPQIIYIRLEENSTSNFDTTSVTLIVNLSPNAGNDSTVELCSNDAPLDLFLALDDSAQTGGIWTPLLTSGTGLFDPSIDIPGIYTYTVGGNSVCPNDSATVTVIVNSLPDINIEDVSFCQGETVIIETGLDTSDYDFSWSFEGVTIPSETQSTLLVTQSGEYMVAVNSLAFNCFASSTFIVNEIDCTDTDTDGVIDIDEDLNENGNLDDDDTDDDGTPNYLDDDDDGDNVDTSVEVGSTSSRLANALHAFIDTDMDLIENYLDDDDDGDNVLTIDEDYNNNGDPTDDDTNNNMIPDYLESTIALGVNDFITMGFTMYPNPAKDKVVIKLANNFNEDLKLKIFDVRGKVINVAKTFNSDIIDLDTSELNSGLYFVQFIMNSSIAVRKLIIE